MHLKSSFDFIIDELPSAVEIEGQCYDIVTDYKEWLRFIKLVNDEELSSDMRIALMVEWYIDEIPLKILSEALEKLIDFMRGPYKEDASNEEEEYKRSTKNINLIDYSIDSGRIIAAFKQDYNIDLRNTNMHWWEFLNYLNNISKDTELMQVIRYRSMDTSKLKGDEKAFYEKMKKACSLVQKQKARPKTKEERDEEFRERVKRRIEKSKMG